MVKFICCNIVFLFEKTENTQKWPIWENIMSAENVILRFNANGDLL